MELSSEQRKIVEAPEDKIIVSAAAGSGKTRCMTERVRWLLKNGVNPASIAVFTFTNMAANELKIRLGEDYKDGLHISTLHSMAAYFLARHGVKINDIINEEKFDKFFTRLEENPECIQHIPYVLVDEFQDLSPLEFNFIFNMIDPDNFFVVGDMRQAIYSFRGASPKLMQNLCRNPEVTVYELTENYRCGSCILDYAKSIIKSSGLPDNSCAMRDTIGGVHEGEYSAEKLSEYIFGNGEYKDWAILCRTNKEIVEICEDLDKKGIPTITFKQGEMTNKELEDAMNSNKVKVLTVHSAKGLTFKYVAVKGMVWWNDESRRVNYVAATRAMDMLIWFKNIEKKKKTYW